MEIVWWSSLKIFLAYVKLGHGQNEERISSGFIIWESISEGILIKLKRLLGMDLDWQYW